MVVRHLLRLTWVLLLLAVPSASSRAEQLPIRTYTAADGLASDTVFRIVADSRGFLWFCTTDGISRFDGYTFITYTTADGLPDNRVSDVHETRDGSLWVATAAGLCRIDPGTPAGGPLFIYVPLDDDPNSNRINALASTQDGALWCGTDAGLFRAVKKDANWSVSRVDIGASAEVEALAEDLWGGVWAGTTGEVRLVRPDGLVEVRPLEGADRHLPVSCLRVDSAGTLWAGTTGGISTTSPRASASATSEPFARPDKAPTGWGNAVFESSDGSLWAATTTGLWRAAGSNRRAFERVAALDGACNREVWDITQDRDGSMWLATSCGALKIHRYGFTSFTEADGLASSIVDSIFETNDGHLVVTTNKTARSVHQMEGARFTSVVPNTPKPKYDGWGWGQTVIQDAECAWWVPTGNGVFRFSMANQPNDSLLGRPEPIYTGRQVFRVFQDSRHDVWFATLGPSGLFRWDRSSGRVVDYMQETGVGSTTEYTAFSEDRSGAVWIGTSKSGLLRYSNGRFERFAPDDGPPAGWIRALYVDGAGRLWIASSRGGLGRVDDPLASQPSFTSYTTADGLSSDNVWCIVDDAWGRIYAGTTHGVDRLDLSTGSIKNYTSADGLPKSQPQVAFRDRHGELWFGSAFGLARLDPEPNRAREAPRTLITGLRVAGVSRPVSALGETALASIELGANDNSVSVEFLGLGTSLGEALKYQYRLDGANSSWSVPSSGRTVTLANLGPGSYRFLVRAVDADGRASPQPAEMAFTVAAPLWRRWWVLLLAGGMAGLAIYSLYRYRVRRLVEIERVRTHIATDLHDDIGANLTKIAALSEIANFRLGGAGGDESLASIADISRESVAAMSDIVWAVSPGRDSFRDLVRRMRAFVNEAFVPRGVDVRFDAPEADDVKLGDELRRHVFLVFKEAVNNAVRHSACSSVDVSLRLEQRRLVLTVSDNGRGFDPSDDVDGNGLANMRKRAAAIGATLEVRSSDGCGTTITLSAPIGGENRFRRRAPPRIGG